MLLVGLSFDSLIIAVGVQYLAGHSGGRPTPLLGRIAGTSTVWAFGAVLSLYIYRAYVRPLLVATGQGIQIRNARGPDVELRWADIAEFAPDMWRLTISVRDGTSVGVDALRVRGEYKTKRAFVVSKALWDFGAETGWGNADTNQWAFAELHGKDRE